MGALTVNTVINTIKAAGLALSLTPDAGLKVTPASAMTPELRDSIKVNRDALVAYLQREAANDDPSEAERELIEERAAIMEFDGGMDRAQAERLALLHSTYLLHHWGCKTCCAAGQGRGQRCTPGADLWAAYDLEATP